MRRALAVVVGVILISLGVVGAAQAVTPTGVCSKTKVLPGDRFSVQGKDALAGEWAHLNFDSHTIGGATVDGFNNWLVAGRIPRSALPGSYQISVTFQTSSTATPCFVRVVRRR